VIATTRDKGGVDAATLVNKWVISIESDKRKRFVTTQRGAKQMTIRTNRFNKNDRQMIYHHLPVTCLSDSMISNARSIIGNKKLIKCCLLLMVRQEIFP
jgi:hypothetical protein